MRPTPPILATHNQQSPGPSSWSIGAHAPSFPLKSGAGRLCQSALIEREPLENLTGVSPFPLHTHTTRKECFIVKVINSSGNGRNFTRKL